MTKPYWSRILKKAFAFYGVFMLLYVLFKFFPIFPLSLIAGITESNFQHYKAAFFSYAIVSLVEYGLNQRSNRIQDRFLYSRLGTTVFLPWMIFILWYAAPALIIRWPNNTLEIIYANVITISVGIFAVIFEDGLETITYNKSLKFILVTLFLVSIFIYLVFTFRLPWADVFIEPDWR